MHKTNFSRAWLDEPQSQSREVYENFLGVRDPAQILKDYVHVVLNEWGDGTHLEIIEIPLPQDFSFWRPTNHPIFDLMWRSEYDEELFRRELAANEVRASCRYANGAGVYVGQGWRDGELIIGAASDKWSKQYALEILPKVIEALGMQGKWRVDWGFSGSSFRPLIVDVSTGLPAEDGGIVKSKSPQHSWEIFQRLMAAHGLNPTHMSGNANLDYKNQLQSYAEQYKSLQKAHPTWNIRLDGAYAEGFDPFVRPKKVPRQGWHFPLARRE